MSRTVGPSPWSLALVLCAVGCGSNGADPDASGDPDRALEPPNVAIGDTTSLPVGERVRFGDTGVDVTFLSLVGDSRCPVGVTCVWEGDAEVRVLLDAPAAHAETSLHTTLEPQSVWIGSYALELIDVLPYPVEGEAADPATRRIVVRLLDAGTGA